MTQSPRPNWRRLLRHLADVVLGPGEHETPAAAPTALAAAEREVVDVVAPVVADLSGSRVGHERLETTLLQALTQDVIAKLDEEHAASTGPQSAAPPTPRPQATSTPGPQTAAPSPAAPAGATS